MRPGKTTHIFQVADHSLKFSGNFDSGNLRNVLQHSPNEYEVQTAFDSYTINCTNKSFFHFYVEGFPINNTLTLVFRQLALFQCLKEDAKRYRPFYSLDGETYERMGETQVETYDSYDGQVLRVNKPISSNRVYFSFALPYSYERYLNMVRDLPCSDEEMYIQKEVLCYSTNLNLVYMISVTSQTRASDLDQKICENTNGIILPEKHLHPPKKYFDKPVILLSSRVHPGETSSSWAMEGILKFITSAEQDAKLLRKHFQIILVPMLNPDGVEEGLYRLDTRGHNLNRYYLISDNRQPSIYCMKHLIRHYQETKRLLYYFDLHGHPNQKGAFLYGNAIDDFPFQVETELFARLLSQLCPSFQEKFCIFDRQQMNSKDKNDMYTKQGCARVYTFRLSNIIHSYTIEHGFHGLSDLSPFSYQKDTYYQEGRSLMAAVLISSGLLEQKEFQLRQMRRQLATEICIREERFRREERHLQLKKNNVNEIVEEYWRPIYQQYFSDSKQTKRPIPKSRHRLRIQKRQSLYLNMNMQNFVSEQLENDQELRTSIEHAFEQNKLRVETNNITFKMHGNHNSLKSTQISTKSDLEEKSVAPKLIRLPDYNSQKRQEGMTSNCFRDKMKGMRRPIALRSIEHSFKREEDHMFSDINIRDVRAGESASHMQGVGRASVKRNKIHSLFIDSQS